MDISSFKLPTPVKTKGSERADIIRQIYDIYRAYDVDRKKENWKRYVSFLKMHRIPDSIEAQEKFRKTKNAFIPTLEAKAIACMFGHLKKNADLYYILSNAKLIYREGGNAAGYIISCTKVRR